MALTSNFDALLKEYAPHDLIEREIKALSWVLKKIKADKSWVPGSAYKIPVELAPGGSFAWGAYPSASDIQQMQVAVPEVSSPKALVGSMIFDQADLERHMSLEKSFVSALPRKLQGLVRRMADLINLTVVGDGSIGTLAANGDATGVVSVGRAATAFLHNGMKVEIDDGDSAAVSGYVQSLDTNAGTFTLKDAATGGSAVDLTNYTTAQSAKVYLVNGSGTRPTSLVDLCFSAANGGADSLYSGAIVKSASPIYQPFTEDISASNTGATLLASLYDVMFALIESGRDGMNSEILVPFNAFKAISKQLETNVNFEKKDEEKVYGSTAITIMGPDSELKIRTARGVPAGKAMILNYDAVSIASYGELIQKGKKVGAEHFEVRNTTGYQMIVDKKAEFEVIGHDLSKLGGVKIATSF